MIEKKEFPRHETQIEKGLTRKEALELCPWKKKFGDVRAFNYDPTTGIATWL